MSTWTPSIVPGGDDQSVYLVLDGFGKHGRSWPETDEEATELETVITNLLDGKYKDPVRIVGFNTDEGWARDVSEEIADEIRRRCDLRMAEVPAWLESFIDRHYVRERERPRLATLGAPLRSVIMMRDVTFTCPQTGEKVTAQMTGEMRSDLYHAVQCTACGWYHVIHGETGKVLGQSEDS